MDRAKEAELFEALGRNEVFKAWLQQKLAAQVEVLVKNNDVVQLHRAQGGSQLIQTMLDLCNKK